jgi:hypothetical protein
MTLGVDYFRTIDLYIKEEYLTDIRSVLPYEEAPLLPDYLVMFCEDDNCGYVEKVSHDEAVRMLRESFTHIAWVQVRKYLGAPANFDKYLEKYIVEKGLHKQISEEDRKWNPYVDRVLKHAEKEYTKKHSNKKR